MSAASGAGEADSGEAAEVLDDETLARLAVEMAMRELSLGDLTPEQRRAFRTAAAAGRIGAPLRAWTPWWSLPFAEYVRLHYRPVELGTGTVAASAGLERSDVGGDVPDPVRGCVVSALQEGSPAERLPPFRALSRAENAALASSLCGLTFAYALCARLFNGDLFDCPAEAAALLHALCPVLSADARFSSPSACLAAAAEHVMTDPVARSLSPEGGLTRGACLTAVRDVAAVLEHRLWVCDAMLSIREVFARAAEDAKRAGRRGVASRRRLALASKKAEFFAAYCEPKAHGLTRDRLRPSSAAAAAATAMGPSDVSFNALTDVQLSAARASAQAHVLDLVDSAAPQ